jgi:hypothetical protein
MRALLAIGLAFIDGSQSRVPQSRYVAFAFSSSRDDPPGYDLLDHGGLSRVVQFPACCIESVADDARRRIVKDASRHEWKNRRHAKPPPDEEARDLSAKGLTHKGDSRQPPPISFSRY